MLRHLLRASSRLSTSLQTLAFHALSVVHDFTEIKQIHSAICGVPTRADI